MESEGHPGVHIRKEVLNTIVISSCYDEDITVAAVSRKSVTKVALSFARVLHIDTTVSAYTAAPATPYTR